MSSSVVAYTFHIVVDFYSCLNWSTDFILYLVRIVSYAKLIFI